MPIKSNLSGNANASSRWVCSFLLHVNMNSMMFVTPTLFRNGLIPKPCHCTCCSPWSLSWCVLEKIQRSRLTLESVMYLGAAKPSIASVIKSWKSFARKICVSLNVRVCSCTYLYHDRYLSNFPFLFLHASSSTAVTSLASRTSASSGGSDSTTSAGRSAGTSAVSVVSASSLVFTEEFVWRSSFDVKEDWRTTSNYVSR